MTYKGWYAIKPKQPTNNLSRYNGHFRTNTLEEILIFFPPATC